jgi:DNA-directed RNA polymerase III subunit RPC1
MSQSIITDVKKNRLKVHVDGEMQYYALQALKRALPGVVVKVATCSLIIRCFHSKHQKGIPTVQRAVINVRGKTGPSGKAGDNELLVEGYGLQQVMTTEGE